MILKCESQQGEKMCKVEKKIKRKEKK